MYISLHVKNPFFLSDFNGIWVFSKDFRKLLKIKFHENPSRGSRVVTWGRTDGPTDMKKLIAAFRKYVKAPKTSHLILHREIMDACSETHIKHINALCGQNVEF